MGFLGYLWLIIAMLFLIGLFKKSAVLWIAVFSLSIMALFTTYANSIPQIETLVPEETEIGGSMTMDQFVALGKKLMHGKGTCELCHAIEHEDPIKNRAPYLVNVVANAGERLKDPRYKGKATNVEEYIRESTHEPSTYVVAGFGKPGTNDTESPMPRINKPPVALSEVEIDAIIAYLQSKEKAQVTVKLPTAAPAPAAAEAAPVPAKTPEEAINKFACGACHKVPVPDAVGEVGPDLTHVGGRRKAAFIRESIVDPNKVVTEGFPPGVMPPDFAEKMTVKELDIIVTYLASLK